MEDIGEKPKSTDSPSTPDEVVLANHRIENPTYIKPQGRKPHDPDVTFEEYYYYAQRTRAEEAAIEAPKTDWREILLRKKKSAAIEGQTPVSHLTAEDFANRENRLEISDEEWTNASRMFRTASWGACEFRRTPNSALVLTIFQGFYLITTDILGPYGVGFSMGTLGWGPGEASLLPPFSRVYLLTVTKESYCILSLESWRATLDI
jgi:hypothetical protein